MDILEVLKREGDAHRLRFVLIGGMAVNAHGYSRNKVDVDDLGFRTLVEKYGTPEAYDRLRKACRTLPDA